MTLYVCVECAGSCIMDAPRKPTECKDPHIDSSKPDWHLLLLFPDGYKEIKSDLQRLGYVVLSPDEAKIQKDRIHSIIDMLGTVNDG